MAAEWQKGVFFLGKLGNFSRIVENGTSWKMGKSEEGGFGVFPLIRWKIAKLDMVNFGKSWDF